MTCRDHPDTPSAAECTTCRVPLCADCLRFEDFKPYCVTHAKPARTRAYGRQLYAIVGALLVFLAGIASLLAWAIFHEPAYDHGEHEHEVGELYEELLTAPCARDKNLRLGELLVQTGDYPAAVTLVDRFRKKCGEWPRLMWVRYSANKYGRAYDAAIADATYLIDHDPDDKDYRWWRGIVYEYRGDFALAAADYEKAIEIEPRLSNIPFNLAAVYEELDRPCDAARALERYFEAHPGDEIDSRNAARIRRLREACGE